MAKDTFGTIKALTKGEKAKLDAEELGLAVQLVELYDKGLRTVVDGVRCRAPQSSGAAVQS